MLTSADFERWQRLIGSAVFDGVVVVGGGAERVGVDRAAVGVAGPAAALARDVRVADADDGGRPDAGPVRHRRRCAGANRQSRQGGVVTLHPSLLLRGGPRRRDPNRVSGRRARRGSDADIANSVFPERGGASPAKAPIAVAFRHGPRAVGVPRGGAVARRGAAREPVALPAASTGGPSPQYPQSRLSISLPAKAGRAT